MNLDELKKKIAELDKIELPEPPSDAHIHAMMVQVYRRMDHLPQPEYDPEIIAERLYEDMERWAFGLDREDDLEL